MKRLTLDVPCKINLSLDICGLLPNGYHEMDMIMQTVGLCDRLTVELLDEKQIQMTCSDSSLPCGDSNLCVRCAKAFLEYAQLPYGVKLHLEKRIPMMAGLGGGSADGAAVLCALNRLCETVYSPETLCQLGFSLGADIPFCLVGGTQRVQGAGERLSPLPPFPENLWILVAKPLFSVSTKAAFQGFDRQEQPQRADVEGMISALNSGKTADIAAKLANVFEPFCQPQEIGRLKAQMLEQGAAGAVMSGSGSAVFALFEEKAKAEACACCLAPQVEQVAVVRPWAKGLFALSEEAVLEA